MFSEVDVFGGFLTIIVVWCAASLVMFVYTNGLLKEVGFFRYVWNPALVRVSLFVISFCSVGLVLSRVGLVL